MRTIYIKGILKYKTGIRKGLDKSDLIEGIDYVEGLGGNDHALYWIRDGLELREFKLGIGAKYVFKHRLKFFNTIDEMKPVVIENEEDVLTLLSLLENKNE